MQNFAPVGFSVEQDEQIIGYDPNFYWFEPTQWFLKLLASYVRNSSFSVELFHAHFVRVAPHPSFARLVRLDDRVGALFPVLCGMRFDGVIATANFPA
jgi:hypothetical protein